MPPQVLQESGYTKRSHAWVAYQIWLANVLEHHPDAGLESTVKFLRANDGTWTVNAEVRECSET